MAHVINFLMEIINNINKILCAGKGKVFHQIIPHSCTLVYNSYVFVNGNTFTLISKETENIRRGGSKHEST